MPPDSVAVAYVETNWLVALAFPHHEHFAEAQALLQDAYAGRCIIRLPVVSRIEAPHAIFHESNRQLQLVAKLKNELLTAAGNGVARLQQVHDALGQPELEAYLQRGAVEETDARVAEAVAAGRIVLLYRPSESLAQVDALRSEVDWPHGEHVDLMIFAEVLADRKADPSSRAVFLSTDKKAFWPHDPVRRQQLLRHYQAHRVLHRSEFDLDSALGAWDAAFGAAG